MRLRRRHQTRAVHALCLFLTVATVQPPGLQAMTVAEEARLGGRFDLEVRAKLPLVRAAEVHRYVAEVGQRIAAQLDEQNYRFHFAALRDGRVNAFAVPGGYVYVNAGLVVQADSDDEIAGVLGHEIAHVQARHLARQEQSSRLLNYAALAGLILTAIQPVIGAGALAASTAAQLKYQRDFEQEADFLGARYMQEGGYDARGMLDFFKQLHQQQLATPTLIPPYLLTHPLTQDRLTNLEAVLRQRQWDQSERRPPSLALERARLLARLELEPIPDVLRDYRRRVEQTPEDGRAQYLWGMALLHSGNAAGARPFLQRAAELQMHGVERELGRAALLERDLVAAQTHLRRATELDPDDALAFRELGRALEAAGQVDGASLAYQRAVVLAPELDDAHYSLGMLAGRAGQAAQGYFHLGQAMLLRGDAEQALSHFAKAEAVAGEPYRAQAATARNELKRLLDN